MEKYKSNHRDHQEIEWLHPTHHTIKGNRIGERNPSNRAETGAAKNTKPSWLTPRSPFDLPHEKDGHGAEAIRAHRPLREASDRTGRSRSPRRPNS